MKKIVLASGSPRRRELLAQLGWNFTVIPSEADEVTEQKDPADIVRELSYRKALETAAKAEEGSIVIGADTMVACGGRVFGKPKDEEDACEMLRQLQGRVHQVYTGVTVAVRNGREYEYVTFEETTDVEFYPMSDAQIREYADTKEPMDKAGAYAIQGIGAKYVKGIRGEYSNVVGLPVARLYQELYQRGLV